MLRTHAHQPGSFQLSHDAARGPRSSSSSSSSSSREGVRWCQAYHSTCVEDARSWTNIYPLSCRWCRHRHITNRHARQRAANDARACLLPAAQQPPAPQYVNRMQHTSRKHAETPHLCRQRCSMWHAVAK
jgi:hypothetical protein